MQIQTLTAFFMWCTIIDAGILILWAILLVFSPDLMYRIQSRWFPVPRETYDAIVFAFVAAFKIVFVVFNLVPYVALLIMG